MANVQKHHEGMNDRVQVQSYTKRIEWRHSPVHAGFGDQSFLLCPKVTGVCLRSMRNCMVSTVTEDGVFIQQIHWTYLTRQYGRFPRHDHCFSDIW